MYSLTEIARTHNRTVMYLRQIQEQFGVPVLEGNAYSRAYAAWFKTILHLRLLGISFEALVKLWELEKKILQLLHVDAVESPTWYLDACGRRTHRRRRLLLTNYDLKTNLFSRKLQLGMNFHHRPVELFKGSEMGEDVADVMQKYLQHYRRICKEANEESHHLASAAGWGRTLRGE